MRLIDADILLKDMDKELETCEQYGIVPSWCTAQTIIKNQKTAYIVENVKIENVIEELKALIEKDKNLIHLSQKEFDVGTQYTYNKAIDDFLKQLFIMRDFNDWNTICMIAAQLKKVGE